jgi:hypothetical protein
MKVIKKILGQQRVKIHEQDDLSRLLTEIDEAKVALNYAQQNLNYAEEYFIDAAAKEVEFSKSRLDALLRRYKEERAKQEQV